MEYYKRDAYFLSEVLRMSRVLGDARKFQGVEKGGQHHIHFEWSAVSCSNFVYWGTVYASCAITFT
jgi:hypothetical protein